MFGARGSKGATGPPSMHLPAALYSMFESSSNAAPVEQWRAPAKRVRVAMSGVGALVRAVRERGGDADGADGAAAAAATTAPPAYDPPTHPVRRTREGIRDERKARRSAKTAERAQKRLASWSPHAPAPDKTEDGYKTLFVGRLAPSVTAETLRAFMAQYGAVKRARVVTDTASGESRGYGFVEFAEDAELQRAFRGADGAELEGRPVVVDVERGRTVSTWVPQRFGGGLGGVPREKGAKVRRGRGAPEPPPPKVVRRRFGRGGGFAGGGGRGAPGGSAGAAAPRR